MKYVVDYYQRSPTDGKDYFMRQDIGDRPVEFEMTHENEKLPALEETKDVKMQRSLHLSKGEDNGEERKIELGPHDYVTEPSLKINSSFLLNVLKSVVDYTNEFLDGEAYGLGPKVYHYPYQELYFHIQELLSYKNEASILRAKHSTAFNEKCDEHIDLLWAYLSSPANMSLKGFHTRLEGKTPVVTFATYWLLLKLGTEVYVHEPGGTLNAYIVHRIHGGVCEIDGKRINSKYEVEVWNLAFDRTQIAPNIRTVEIDVFDNEREVVSLPLYPIRFVDTNDGGRRRDALIDRGKKYFEYCKRPSFLQYSGTGLKHERKTVILIALECSIC